ncbi:MAG: bifunctional aspartate kinase/homoserine dehydrogenase I [Bacteroidota bacterium]|nr:bifunctional aspartate kinase/homoserine dehydrogenase I [Candidatus Kapabacteria bacterium]MDW8220860.1 bifunctional aspartate kinase/homoserine dehydrogenase I [Bacteroidota bacterium]
MVILKFGGSSVGTPERINSVINICTASQQQHGRIAVVVSAFSGITDQLITTARLASQGNIAYSSEFDSMYRRHMSTLEALFSTEGTDNTNLDIVRKEIEAVLMELRGLLHGIFLIRELSHRTLDYVCSFGERLSACIIARTMVARGINAEFLDARTVIRTNHDFTAAKVDFPTTNAHLQKYFAEHTALTVITGFIGSTSDGQTTTLGRGGSDYTAAIVGAALHAKEIEIWTDVDGVMTADPRKVNNARTLERLTYEEAMELSHFGAKVIYPPTIQPALELNIPLRIRNTFNPDFPGTLIDRDGDTESSLPIKGISSIKEIALLSLEGSGMVGVVGVAHRLFSALARERVNVIMITQASSEHSICIAIEPQAADNAARSINDEFTYEINVTRQIHPVSVEKGLSVIAVVGKNMRHTPGIAGKVFQALGRNGVNVRAIAQGSSELNISIIVNAADESKAIRAIHNNFFLASTKTLHLFVVGTGLIGTELLNQIRQQHEFLLHHRGIDLKIIGLANSTHMLFNDDGIRIDTWSDDLHSSPTPMNARAFLDEMKARNIPNKVFIDNTTSEDIAGLYEEILASSIAVVTPNKKANTGTYAQYKAIREAALRANVGFFYETNVGGGLPIIDTIRGLVSSGDKIHSIEAICSGTLSYVFNTFTEGKRFSDVIREARDKGFTEPDPRDDLSGMDVARKLLILAREIGLALELRDIDVESLVPASCVHASSVEEFFDALSHEDAAFEQRRSEAAAQGKALRYVASLHHGKGSARLEAVDAYHPFFSLNATDNKFAIISDYYATTPLVIQGPGAGAKVTASGVLADILRTA